MPCFPKLGAQRQELGSTSKQLDLEGTVAGEESKNDADIRNRVTADTTGAGINTSRPVRAQARRAHRDGTGKHDAFQGRGEQWSCKCYSRASTPLRAVPHHINGTIWQSAEAAGLGGWIEHAAVGPAMSAHHSTPTQMCLTSTL
eukprot:jgi/Chrzof1/6732/Cz19g07030.t1